VSCAPEAAASVAAVELSSAGVGAESSPADAGELFAGVWSSLLAFAAEASEFFAAGAGDPEPADAGGEDCDGAGGSFDGRAGVLSCDADEERSELRARGGGAAGRASFRGGAFADGTVARFASRASCRVRRAE
jgi:hypothetical protein